MMEEERYYSVLAARANFRASLRASSAFLSTS